MDSIECECDVSAFRRQRGTLALRRNVSMMLSPNQDGGWTLITKKTYVEESKAAEIKLDNSKENVMLQNLGKDDVIRRINELLEEDNYGVEENMGRCLLVSRHGKDAVYFDKRLQHWCLEKRGLYPCSRDKVKSLLRVWDKILSALQDEVIITPRGIYYGDVKLFGKKQAHVDEIITDICCRLGCTRYSTNVIPPPRGRIIGSIQLVIFQAKPTKQRSYHIFFMTFQTDHAHNHKFTAQHQTSRTRCS